ncbi:hypothetical protein AB4Y90_08780 [Chryseobacterium sp. 2TAF14]|uniref:hypothetical protein n=1 Tax=Chryseobacterium sp. 2TAF14 TaxID=3233007 RepID=UPI003F8F1064
MKKLSVIISSFCVMLSYAQKVSDYKYVVVPGTFESFKKDNYGLSALLTKNLKAKQYTIISENRGQWPEDANANPCSVLNADLVNDSNFLRNKIILEFKDCNSKVISSEKGGSSIKEFAEGYQDALSKALVAIPISKPTEQNNMVYSMNRDYSMNNVQEGMKQEPVRTESKRESDKSVRFSNGKINLQKIQIDETQFILADGNSSVPFATFKETTKKDVFRVKLSSGESTTGYYENGNLVIEIPKGNDEYSKEVFSPVK